jgi:hypothetical protein
VSPIYSFNTLRLTLARRNVALLSFGAEPEETGDSTLPATKFKSSHDALDDPRLSKVSLDDRGTSATLPASMEGTLGGQKRKAPESDVSPIRRWRESPLTLICPQSRTKPSEPSSSKLELAKDVKAKAVANPK